MILFNLSDKKLITSIKIPGLEGQTVTSVSRSLSNHLLAVGTSAGNAATFQIKFPSNYSGKNNREIVPQVDFGTIINLDSLNIPIEKIVYRKSSDDEFSIAGVLENNKLIFYSSQTTTNLLDGKTEKIYKKDISSIVNEKITSIEMDDFCEKLMIGSEKGWLYYISTKEKDNPQLVQKLNVTPSGNSPIAALGFVIGDQSLIVGDASGRVSSWMRIIDANTEYGWQLVNPHVFDSHTAEVTNVSSSSRNKSFITGDKSGKIFVEHLTSEKTLLELSGKNEPIKDVYFTPKSDGARCSIWMVQ